MNVGDVYEPVRLLNPKRFPRQQNPVKFTILAINPDDTVDIRLEDGKRQTESVWFIKFFCKKV